MIQRAVAKLPAGEREAVTLFYFVGESLRAVARALGVSVASAGKRVYSARIRLRRRLPRSVTEAFLVVTPTPAFSERVKAGMFDEFAGEYRLLRARATRCSSVAKATSWRATLAVSGTCSCHPGRTGWRPLSSTVKRTSAATVAVT